MMRSVNEENAEETRKVQIVKSAISTLSFSELEAITHIFDELDGNEGILVASKIADRVGITRSVIVNALRTVSYTHLDVYKRQDERRAVWDISQQGAYRQLSLFDDMKLNMAPAPVDRYSVVTGSM